MKNLTYELRKVNSLQKEECDRMFELMSSNYNHISPVSFKQDLSWKQFVILVKDDSKTIQGFSTLAIDPKGTGTSGYSILFSGDTIINPAYWGTQELAKAFFTTAGQLLSVAQGLNKKLYWYLISKGHRTYMYLPLFSKKYFPSVDEQREESSHLGIVDRCSKKLFGDAWDSKRGLLSFLQNMGCLNEELAQGTYQRAHNPNVAFFLKRNPNFYKGDELVCMTEFSVDNLRGIAQRCLIQGMQQETDLSW